MSQLGVIDEKSPSSPDYSLTGVNAKRAIENGLAEADWYQCLVPREVMRDLVVRRDGPAIRDTVLWFVLIGALACATCILWGTWWAILPYIAYSVLYASAGDSRWHESGHGTAFKTDWMNNALYEIASFMMLRESTVWRWSHNRHHSDTIIVGRDPEIAVPRPPRWTGMVQVFFGLHGYRSYFRTVPLHCLGRMTAAEKTFIPEDQFERIYWTARVHAVVYAGLIALSIYEHSILPVMLVGLVNLFGSWLSPIYGFTQHAGLAENVLDHRLNCRTVYMNLVNRYLYWNMNYHLEHHMFPLVPYHALPKLHELIKEDCPPSYGSILQAWREILPTVRRQRWDPAYHVKRRLPEPKLRARQGCFAASGSRDAEGWMEVCADDHLRRADVIRFDHDRKTFAIYRDEGGELFATDGLCTHGNTHLADGLVKDSRIKCPKHNGRFNLIDGSPARAPICRGLATYPVAAREGRIWIDVAHARGAGARAQRSYRLRVASNRSVTTFIKELVFEPESPEGSPTFAPGDYLQFEIPAYESISFRDFDIPEPFASVWERQHVFDLVAHNPQAGRHNNYSLACNPHTEKRLRFNVRLATPPQGQDCSPGVGSSYLFSLKAGDIVSAVGPFGDFHIKPTQREMVYIGGGAGMAPLRAHLSYLLDTERTVRRISYWYGARSRQEVFYDDYFRELEAKHPNFSFHLALSSPLDEDRWTGQMGFIHEVVLQSYLWRHTNAAAAEYYLCGPPMMIKACNRMLAALGVPVSQIAYDEF